MALYGVEVGTGIAIWSDLFPHATVHALDQFRAGIFNNTAFLLAKATSRREPNVMRQTMEPTTELPNSSAFDAFKLVYS
eukprot:4034453-Amphidinium_carterae.2